MKSTKHEPEVQIYHGSIDDDLRKLLTKVALDKNTYKIHISPYNRYGYSGSKLYKLYFSDKEEGSVSFLLKTFKTFKDREKFNTELEGIKLFETYYDYIYGSKPYSTNKLSGILLLEHKNKTKKEPITFKNIMYEADEDKVCKIIKKTFEDLKNAYNSDIITEICNIKELYSRYFR